MFKLFPDSSYAQKSRTQPPQGMDRPHAHHIVMRNGPDGSQDAIQKSKAILTKYNIDWYADPRNLTWAPNLGLKNHTVEYAAAVQAELEKAHTGNVTERLFPKWYHATLFR